MANEPNTSQTLTGVVDRVAFHNLENGFCVLRVTVRGHADTITIIGSIATIAAGERVTAQGGWANDRVHGMQFRATAISTEAPDNIDGIEKYLASGAIRGIGPVYARKLIATFGTDVLDIMENHPERLRDVDGIGKMRAKQIAAGWAEQKSVRDIMVFLHKHGVGTARAARIYKAYGDDSIALITENPYRLASDIQGIGFRVADGVAENLGIGKSEMIRLRAGISFALSEAQSNGHCGLPRTELLEFAATLLEVAFDEVEDALNQELADGKVVADEVADEDCIFLTQLHRAEKDIADRLKILVDTPTSWADIDLDAVLPKVESETGLSLADSQKAAVGLALKSKVLVITGGPGVGKTTLVNTILRVLTTRSLNVVLAAPTGRAAKRLTETTGREAKTIHRLLEADPASGGFKRTAGYPLEADLVVIDEMSMVDVLLAQALFAAIPDKAAVLLVGDVDQLPSVGPGQVLADLIKSDALPTIRLTEVFRQAAESRIVTAAHAINDGHIPDLDATGTDSDFFFVEADDPERAADLVRILVSQRIPNRFGHDPVRDIQVLSPMNKGGLGARSLNTNLQAALNPPGSEAIQRFGWQFDAGDKVMQIRNDYDRDVYNGDIGFIDSIDPESGNLEIKFDGRPVAYETADLESLSLAYATTIHKAQGSEYPVVVIPVMTQHYAMLQRNLIYTAVTRGRNLVILVGQKKALAIAINNVSGRRRWSKLREWLAN